MCFYSACPASALDALQFRAPMPSGPAQLRSFFVRPATGTSHDERIVESGGRIDFVESFQRENESVFVKSQHEI